MNTLVIDLTHGGVKIAVSLAKKGQKVYAFDIYNTLNPIDNRMLEVSDIELIQLEDLKNFNGNLKVIYPIHLPLSREDIKKYNPNLNYSFLTHHEAIAEILDNWGKDIKKVEITGVKGKTSCAFMLKEILLEDNPLILSSLGALIYEDEKEIAYLHQIKKQLIVEKEAHSTGFITKEDEKQLEEARLKITI